MKSILIFTMYLIDWSERVKKIAKAWRELSSDEKQPFLVRLCFSTIFNNYFVFRKTKYKQITCSFNTFRLRHAKTEPI